MNNWRTVLVLVLNSVRKLTSRMTVLVLVSDSVRKLIN